MAINVNLPSSTHRLLSVGMQPVCSLQEDEGLTAIVEKQQAERALAPYVFEARLITLTVHSPLKAVGFLATISKCLAQAELSHSRAAVTNISERTLASVVSGHSVIYHASDRITAKTGYSQMDGTKPWMMDRFSVGRSGTPDPEPPLSAVKSGQA